MKRLYKGLLPLSIALMFLFAQMTFAFADSVQFYDVSENTPYHDAIEYCSDTDRAIISGDGAGYFHPDEATTRADFTIMLLRTLQISVADASGENTFNDVDPSSYYAPYISKAYSMNIIHGCGDNNMMPSVGMRAEDAAVILYNYFVSEDTAKYLVAYSIPEDISVNGTISSYAADACNWALGTGIMNIF
jgi:hypothetical protein